MGRASPCHGAMPGLLFVSGAPNVPRTYATRGVLAPSAWEPIDSPDAAQPSARGPTHIGPRPNANSLPSRNSRDRAPCRNTRHVQPAGRWLPIRRRNRDAPARRRSLRQQATVRESPPIGASGKQRWAWGPHHDLRRGPCRPPLRHERSIPPAVYSESGPGKERGPGNRFARASDHAAMTLRPCGAARAAWPARRRAGSVRLTRCRDRSPAQRLAKTPDSARRGRSRS